jgi:hypothetical protein
VPPVELKSLVREIVDRITVAADRIEIQLSRAKIAAALQVGEPCRLKRSCGAPFHDRFPRWLASAPNG